VSGPLVGSRVQSTDPEDNAARGTVTALYFDGSGRVEWDDFPECLLTPKMVASLSVLSHEQECPRCHGYGTVGLVTRRCACDECGGTGLVQVEP